MIPELGQFALVVALALAVIQAVLPLAGAASERPAWMAVARPAAVGQLLFVALAFALLATSFATNDFSVANVARNSNTALPLHYRVAASWGSHEGSIVLWTLMLAAWTCAVAGASDHLPAKMAARVLGVMGLVSTGFLLFIVFTSSPFRRLTPVPSEGADLNPLLQDPGMVFHPPMLYMGYVGFSVAFAFAIAALIEGRFDAAWARWSRPWTTAAWCFLTLGIALGSAWAYYELGWGGWWFWDPVENASFMPWLLGTALIHSLAVTEKRGAFRGWTVLLAILTFSLSLLGTFLVRSGVLTSVHAFATDPTRGAFILVFLVLVVGGSLALYALRAPRVGFGGNFAPVSRESMLLANNVFLAAAMAAVLLGTLYPLFLDVLGAGKISVGPPYFDAVFYPLMVPAILLMAIGPLASWKRAALPDLWARLEGPGAASLCAAVLVPLAMGRWTPGVAFGVFLGAWVAAATLAQLVQRLRLSRSNSAAYYGMTLAHLGVATFILGVTLVKGYESERDLRMAVGDSATVGGYVFRFAGTREAPGPNYAAMQATIEVMRAGSPRVVVTLYPEKRVYRASGQTLTEAAIDPGIARDLYVSLGEPAGDGSWAVRLYHKPFVGWIWGGCVLMALGGGISLRDRRYRAKSQADTSRRLLGPA